METSKNTIFDVVTDATVGNYQITATDLEGATQTVISNENARMYLKRRYAGRTFLTYDDEDAKATLAAAFSLFKANRQHNIDKLYQAVFDYDYSPIENVDRYETEETTRDDDLKHGHVVTDGGTDTLSHGEVITDGGTDRIVHGHTVTDGGTETYQHGHTVTDSGSDRLSHGETHTLSGTDVNGGTTGSKTTTRPTETVTNTKAGFNSPNSYTPESKSVKDYSGNETVTDTQKYSTQYGKTDTASGTDQTTYGKVVTNGGTDTTGFGKTVTEGGTDQTQHGKTETHSGSDQTTYGKTETHSGKDERDETIERELRVHGNIGVTSNVDLITQEIDLRLKSIAEMLLDDFVNQYTYYA